MTAELIEHIEAFLDGQITRAALQEHADRLGVQDLEEKIEWVINSRTAIEASGVREQLKVLLPQASKARTSTLRVLRPYLAVAASVLVLVIAYLGFRGGESTRLYEQYTYVDPGVPVLMSQSDAYLLYNALTYYNEENYAVAVEELTKIKDQFADNDTLSYFLAASLLYENRPAEASLLFEEVSSESTSGFSERADWMRVLCALKEKDKETGEQLLTKILSNPNHEFHQQAEALQKDWIQ